jgi:ubiquitin carboxyl-terminal hydrolase 14
VKKSVFHPPTLGAELESDEDWYKFDDDKVSVFPKEKLGTLDGGGTLFVLVHSRFLFKADYAHIGEDSAAYVLLYKTKPLA